MLYKKVHRQYVKEFRRGRKYEFDGKVREVTRKPHINIEEGGYIVAEFRVLIRFSSGEIYQHGMIWLED